MVQQKETKLSVALDQKKRREREGGGERGVERERAGRGNALDGFTLSTFKDERMEDVLTVELWCRS